MAHFAELDSTGTVTRVVVVANEVIMRDGEERESVGVEFLNSLYGHSNWKQTSYNGRIRSNYASVGSYYDAGMDSFIPPQPFPSWVLDTQTARWQPPVPRPAGDNHRWDEAGQRWVPRVLQ